ncbi:Rpn family recombination-promoting nuclease/putative transposase (plasmid) [Enterococcus gilvus]|jgi:predicted transposase/invertase (TIGR01784 family)|uniref:Rpn family recombination-promoting nuclease/putative transposase n=1 Tax=Enterococcus gilvus TaxID=160453 RepID=UPI000DF6031A|nr:Rpn family recombination-promoting nuclease/putative transposase [Enterococcus gilvus]AXG40438.1 Rpn family recombination-promoting nuclease/putative transposase [Enterococcus gilvus]
MPNYLPTNDLLFKKIMTSEDSLYILKAFVNDLLGTNFKTLRPRETYHIDTYKRTLQKENGEEICRTEVDILATAEDGSQATIECQIHAHDYFHERALFYLAEAYRSPYGDIKKQSEGKPSSYASLRPVYGINIMGYDLFNEKEHALQLFQLLNAKTQQVFVNRAGKELLLLCFFRLKNHVRDRNTALYHWQYFFTTGDAAEDAPEYIKDAKAKIDYLSLESEEKEMIMRAEKNREIQALEISTAARVAREEGERKGERKGRMEEKSKVAMEMIKDGINPQTILKYTGLTLSAIEKLKDEKTDSV